MAFSVLASGTRTMNTTNWSLVQNTSGPTNNTDIGVYEVVLDLVNLSYGDLYALRIYEKSRAADTQRLAEEYWFTNPIYYPIQKIPIGIMYSGWDVCFQKSLGTDRTVTWSILRIN